MYLITVVIPTYNSAATIVVCLDSVINQNYSNAEIIIVDGISTDETISIVEKYSNKYSNIRWISEKDKGIYDAMNKGISLATGDWLYFLGSDDYILDNDVLSDVAKKLEYTQSDLVYGDAIVVSDGACRGGEFSLQKLLTKGNLCHQTIFYRKRLFSLLGNYNLKYPIIADWDFNIRCFQHPFVQTEYIERSIVIYNDVTGVSSTSRSDYFYDLVPVTYIKELENLKNEKEKIIRTAEYKLGKIIYDVLKNIGIISLIRKIR